MELMLNEGEQIYYSRDYSKGRKKSKGNVTVTDERVVSTVESKYGTRKTEIALDEVGGVTTRFKYSNIWSFVFSGIFAILCVVYNQVVGPLFGGSASSSNLAGNAAAEASVNSMLDTVQIVVMAITIAGAVISFLIGLFSLRNGFYVVVGTTSGECFELVTATDYLGGLRPLVLKTKRVDALQMMSEISAALLNAKAKSKQN